MIKLEQIRTKMQEAIVRSGLTQIELARRLNIKYQTVGQYLSGRAMPSLETFANLCTVLDLDANEILCISNAEKIIKKEERNSIDKDPES